MPLPAPGPLITLTTAPNGDGSLDFEFRALMILAGTSNDAMYRLVDNDAAPTTEQPSLSKRPRAASTKSALSSTIRQRIGYLLAT